MQNQVTLSENKLTVSVTTIDECDLGNSLTYWGQLAMSVLRSENVDSGQLDISFISSAEIHKLNKEHMGYDEPTDVLSFPMDEKDAPESEDKVLGTIAISYEQAEKNTIGYREEKNCDYVVNSEIALLVVHGVFHVLGYDHYEPNEKTEMVKKETNCLAKFDIVRRDN